MPDNQFILPTFDPECRRIFHADKKGAQAQLVAMEVWNRATGRDLKGRQLVVYRCTRCWGYHVSARFVGKPRTMVPELDSSPTHPTGEWSASR